MLTHDSLTAKGGEQQRIPGQRSKRKKLDKLFEQHSICGQEGRTHEMQTRNANTKIFTLTLVAPAAVLLLLWRWLCEQDHCARWRKKSVQKFAFNSYFIQLYRRTTQATEPPKPEPHRCSLVLQYIPRTLERGLTANG